MTTSDRKFTLTEVPHINLYFKMLYLIGCRFNKAPILSLLLILASTHIYKLQATEDSKMKPKQFTLSPHEEDKLWNTTNENNDKTEFVTSDLGYKEKAAYISDEDINKSLIDSISRFASTKSVTGSIGPPSVGNINNSIPYEAHNSNEEDYNSLYYNTQPGSNNNNGNYEWVADIYYDVGFGPDSTSEPNNCKNTCSTRSSSLNPNYKPLESCGCDEECGARDDCCEDAPSEYQQRPKNQYIECIFEKEYDRQGKYGIRRCPDNAPKSLSLKCLKDVVQEDYTYILDIPVVSKTTGIYYQNIYCAQCNGDNADIKESIIGYSCPNYPVPLFADVHFNMIYQPGKLKWTQNISKTDIVHKSDISKDFWEMITYEGKFRSLECSLQLTNFPSISTCVDYISNCSSSFKNDHIKQKCHAYKYIVVDYSNQIYYRNGYCAICNNVTDQYISCNLDVSNFGVTTYSGFQPDISDFFNLNPPKINITNDPLMDNNISIESIENENMEKRILTACMFSISFICMIAHMTIFFILYEKRNVPSMNLFCLTLSLFIAEFVFLTFSLSTDNYIGCYTTAMIMYFAFTAALFWMNVMSFDIYKTFSSKQYSIKSTKLFIKYSIYAWGTATMFSLIVLTADMALPEDSKFKPDFGNNYCWFNRSNLKSMIIFFILPSSLIIISNFILYIKTVFVIYRQFQDANFATSPPTSSTSLEEITHTSNGSLCISNERSVNGNSISEMILAEIREEIKDRRLQWRQFVVFSKLAVIMGISWIFGFFFAITGSEIIGQIFTMTTSLQGTFIFIIFNFKLKIFQEIRNKWSY